MNCVMDIQKENVNHFKHKITLSEGLNIFISGGVAGCVSKTVVAPLDRVKILLHNHSSHYRNLGVCGILLKIKNFEGFLALYKGNGVQMLRIFPYSAVQFIVFEKCKEYLVKDMIPGHPHIDKLIAGCIAGVMAVTFTYPLDLLWSRISCQVKGEHKYNGLIHAAKSLHFQGGLKALFKGFTPTVLGMLPYAGFSFFTFEYLKTMMLQYNAETFGEPCPRNSGGFVLRTEYKLFCGAVAGATAQSISYPLDVVKRKMQLIGMYENSERNRKKKWYQIFKMILKEEGVIGLYRGLSINYLRVVPAVAVSFTVYENMKQRVFGLDTGFDAS